MGFCELTVKDGIFFLILGGGDDGSHNYLTVQSMEDLEEKLKMIRDRVRVSSKGLVTTCFAGSFCDGVDYDESSPPVVDELAHSMAEVLQQLFNMPFPTVAAVTGDVKTSLALALVLAHDDATVLKKASFEAPEVRDGHDNLPPYVAALLRDKAPYPLMRSSLVLQSEAMKGSDMSYWYVVDATPDSEEEVVDTAINIITFSIGEVRDGEAYITTRKSFFPESWKAISEFLRDYDQ